MTTLEIIKNQCESNGITISQLEKELGFSNGSISKSKSLSAERVLAISRYFGKPMEYFMTGETLQEVDNQMQKLLEKQNVLVEINKVQHKMLDMEDRLKEYQRILSNLRKKYAELEEGDA